MNRKMILAASTLVLISAIQAKAESVELVVDVFSPSPPITPVDVVTLRARTPVEVFPDSGHEISSLIFVSGFNIDWDITSTDGDPDGALPVTVPMVTVESVSPLPPGTYHVTANWNHIGSRLLLGAPSSGTGSLTFVVIPEPSALAMLAIGTLLAAFPLRHRPTCFRRSPTARS